MGYLVEVFLQHKVRVGPLACNVAKHFVSNESPNDTHIRGNPEWEPLPVASSLRLRGEREGTHHAGV